MAEAARVDSIEVLRTFRSALWKFAEIASSALGDADSEMQRTLNWLEREQAAYWEMQMRKRGEAVQRAADAVRSKTLYKSAATGTAASAAEEQQALNLAKKRLQEAGEKLNNCRKWRRRLQKEIEQYKGSVQQLATAVEGDIPVGAARLERMTIALEAYVRLAPEQQAAALAAASAVGAPAPSLAMAGNALKMLAALHASTATLPQKLREQTPSLSVRSHAPPGHLDLADIPTPPLSEDDLRSLAAVKAKLQPVDPEETLVFSLPEGRAALPANIYLERGKPCAPDDTGWYLGAADEHRAPVYHRVKIADLLAIRPEWQALLALPEGFVVHLVSGKMTLLLNPVDDDLLPLLAPKAATAPDQPAP